MFNTIENRMKVKAVDKMTDIWNRYIYVISDEGYDGYRQRFRSMLNGDAWIQWYAYEDDEDSNINFILYYLEKPESEFNWFDYVLYYTTIITFDTETNRKKVDTFDKMTKLYQDYKNHYHEFTGGLRITI